MRLTPDATLRNRIRNENTFDRLVAQAFSMRRKTLANALRGWLDADRLRALEIDPGWRPERLRPQDFVALANACTD